MQLRVHDPRRRGKAVLAASVLALLVVVAFFVYYDHRDSKTLSEGTRTTGTVVGFVQPSLGWLEDYGKLRVAYDHEGHHETTIWLDNEIADYRVGQQVPVFIRGSHIRTDREPNDPAPLGFVMFLLGVGSLVGAGWGGFRLLPSQQAAVEVPLGAVDRIPLKAFRLAPRKPFIDVLPGQLSLFLPSFFGRHRLTVPIAETALTPLDEESEEAWEEIDDTYFKEPLVIADLPTAAAFVDGDLLLTFRRPVRVPALRWIMAMANNVDLPFGWFSTRSAEGARVDGVRLRALDLDDAVQRLARAGVTVVQNPGPWLAALRRVETDPAAIARIDAEEAQEGRWVWWSGAGWTVATLCWLVGAITDRDLLFIAGAVFAGLAWIGPWVASRLLRRGDG